MSVFHIYSSIYLKTDQRTAWEFLSTPSNLLELTPPRFKMKVMAESDIDFRPGAIYGFSLEPFPGFRTGWLSEITHVEAPHRFTDIQWEGPYAFWHHTHGVRQVSKGCTQIFDRIFYKLPFGLLGASMHGIAVRPGLRETFAYRTKKMYERFGKCEGYESELFIGKPGQTKQKT